MSIIRGLLLGLVFLPVMVDTAAAQQVPVTTSGSGSVQIFAVTASAVAQCTSPPAVCGALVSLPIDLKSDSVLTIRFSARGMVSMASTQIVEVSISCDVDGTRCNPGAGPQGSDIQFLYPQFCCDARSFTWVTPAVKGTHIVHINWTTSNSGTAFLTDRTLHLEAVPTSAK
jgi:hypothetical protein